MLAFWQRQQASSHSHFIRLGAHVVLSDFEGHAVLLLDWNLSLIKMCAPFPICCVMCRMLQIHVKGTLKCLPRPLSSHSTPGPSVTLRVEIRPCVGFGWETTLLCTSLICLRTCECSQSFIRFLERHLQKKPVVALKRITIRLHYTVFKIWCKCLLKLAYNKAYVLVLPAAFIYISASWHFVGLFFADWHYKMCSEHRPQLPFSLAGGGSLHVRTLPEGHRLLPAEGEVKARQRDNGYCASLLFVVERAVISPLWPVTALGVFTHAGKSHCAFNEHLCVLSCSLTSPWMGFKGLEGSSVGWYL